MKHCFHHWRTITEQSLESLSATFIAKFHVSALTAGGRSATGKESVFHNMLMPHRDTPKIITQYQMSVLSVKSGTVNNGLVDLPVIHSTPVLRLCDEKAAPGLSNKANYLQVESNVKRQLFNDTSEELTLCSHLSSPCHCLDAEVVNQLANLQQDLSSSVNKLESSLSQDCSSLVSPELTGEVVLSCSDTIISPPIEFSEHCSVTSLPASSVETVSMISRRGSMEFNIISEYFSSRTTLGYSYALFNKLLSIVKLMQHYPVSVTFVAWRRFVQKRKSLAVLRAEAHHMINHNTMINAFTLWKLCTHKVLEYKQLEMSCLANSQKRTLGIALQKWITVYHKRLKDSNILGNLLTSKNQHILKNSFFKWKRNFEINIGIRNHMVNNTVST